MHIGKGRESILSVDDWFAFAPPKQGIRHWKDYRSAKELAKSWCRTTPPSPPQEMIELLRASFKTDDILLTHAYPECVVMLDDFGGEHRNADLVIVGTAGKQKLVISLEAKADEPFGDQHVGEYYDARGSVPGSNLPARIDGLVRAIFDSDLDQRTRPLRYQLLHAVAGALIEAKRLQADIAVFLVHEFISHRVSSTKLERNKRDWESFVAALSEGQTLAVRNDQLTGPLKVRGGTHVPSEIPLLLGKFQTVLE